MILKKQSSRIFLVNLFADFIISKISSEEQSIINVVDCKNFFLIKGITTSNTLLNLSDILTEFNKKYSEYQADNQITHTIDLIEYDKTISPIEKISFTFHNTENCSYHYKQIEYFKENNKSCVYDYFVKELDDMMIVSSEFPHGYSLGQGRLLYYYGKHIFYNIPSNYPITTLTFNFSKQTNQDNVPDFSVINNFSGSEDETLKSWVLDYFDFDMTWLLNEIKKVDWSVELTNPLEEYDFLTNKIKDSVII